MSPEDEAELRQLVMVEYRLSENRSACCDGKEGFDSWALAVTVAARMRTNYHGERVSAPKRCHYCGKYHIVTNIIRKKGRTK